MIDDRACVVIQTGTEAGEGLEFLELCISQLEVAGDGAVRRPLCFTTHARNGFADIDRRQYA